MTTHALIFANGELNDGPMVRRALTTAMPDAMVIAADAGARLAGYFGLMVNTVIGDMDSLSPAELEMLTEQGTNAKRYPQEKNETDLELALLLAVKRGARWLRIIGALGGRFDQELGNLYLLALPALAKCDARIVAGKQEIWIFRGGGAPLEIQGAKGDTISLVPLNGPAVGVRTANLFYPLKDEPLEFGPARGISNVMTAKKAKVALREGTLLVVHTIGRA
ncbi:MAG: thiamine diphosphokinase [Burkholderiales bacterium]|nr:thiamine diphosphokinase [Anaerolineae bacterium]